MARFLGLCVCNFLAPQQRRNFRVDPFVWLFAAEVEEVQIMDVVGRGR
jgi:hypothetical protein